MACFRQDYLDLLDGRVLTIQRLVTGHDLEPAHVALLSLESSSAMVGAAELAATVRRLRTALEESEVQESFAAGAIQTTFRPAAEMQAVVRSSTEFWRRAFRELNIAPQ